MAQSKSIIFITFILLAVLLSGCLYGKNTTAVPATTVPEITTNVTSVPTVMETQIPSQESPTPEPSATPIKEAPSTALYVTARMKPMSNWSSGNEIKYELNWLKVYILNQQNEILPIKAQIISGDQILEEKSFVLNKLDSSVEFSNERNHFVRSTNVTLRVFIKDYQPIDYPFLTVDQIS